MRFSHEFIDMTLAGSLFAVLTSAMRVFVYGSIRFDVPVTLILVSGFVLGGMLWWVIVLRPGRFTGTRGFIAGAAVGVLAPLVAALGQAALLAMESPAASVTAGWSVGYATAVVGAIGTTGALSGGILGAFLAWLG